MRQTRSRQHDRKCRLKSIYFNHPSQGNSTGSQRQGCASHKSTNKTIPPEATEEPSDTAIHPFLFLFLPHPQESSALSQSQAMFVELGECSQNMLSEAFWTPNIASSQLDEYSELYLEQKFAQLRTSYIRRIHPTMFTNKCSPN